MQRRTNRLCVIGIVVLGLATGLCWGQAKDAKDVGVVSGVKVISSAVPDVSSIEAWKKSYIKEGMSDKDKAMAVFNTWVAFQHADASPQEFIQHEDVVLDPIKMMNVYGHSFCSISSSHVAACARAAGLKARNATIQAHVVPEIFYDGAWHLMDADLIQYFPKADGAIASVAEIEAGIQAYLTEHPEFPISPNKKADRYKLQNGGAWRKGPEVLSRNPFFDENGWLPNTVFAWGDTMQQYSKFAFNYESGYSLGYQVNIQLRPGEKLVRNWSNKKLWINMDTAKNPPEAMGKIDAKGMNYARKWGDLGNERIGNGTLVYDVPLADGTFRKTALMAENLAAKVEDASAAAAVVVKDAARNGVLEIRMPTSYVYITGKVALNAVVGEGGEVKVLASVNNGLDWTEVAAIDKSGEQTLDISKLVIRKYDYRLRVVLKGKGTGLSALRIAHDIQHSQRPLPALKQGTNTITFAAGDPAYSTITYEASSYGKNKGKALTYEDLHAKVANINPHANRWLHHKGGEPTTVEFTVQTPVEMSRLRIFGFCGTGSPRETHWNAEVSFDEGKTFKSLTKVEEAEVFNTLSAVVTEIPPGTKSAVVRYVGSGSDSALLLNYRIDADYKEPTGGFAPVKITYVWEEGGIDKTHEHVAASASETYTIKCDGTPKMKSITVELADAKPAAAK